MEDQEVRSQAAAPGATVGIPPRPFRVLLVRPAGPDSRRVRESLAALPFDPPPEVVTAESGEAALEIASRAPFDVAVADLLLAGPGLSGATTLIRLRELNPGSRTLLVSSHAYVRSLVGRAADAFLVCDRGPWSAEFLERLGRAVAGDEEAVPPSRPEEAPRPPAVETRTDRRGTGIWARLFPWLRRG